MVLKRTFTIASIVLLLISSIIPFLQIVSSSDPNQIWYPLGSVDGNEGGKKNDWRDVKQAYYSFKAIDNELSLSLECYGFPGSEWLSSGGRYKWFIDTSTPSDIQLSGGNIVGAEYLLYVEDTDDDGVGENYLVVDTDGDSSFNDEPIISGDYNFVVTGNSINITFSLDLIDYSRSLGLSWATDQEDPNLDAAPNNDRVDGKTGVAGILATSITVYSVVSDVAPSSPWSYVINGPEGYSVSFTSPADGGLGPWFSGYGLTPGIYTVAVTSKFGYYTTIDVESELDAEADIFDYSVQVGLQKDDNIIITFSHTNLPAFTVPLSSPPPVEVDYNLPGDHTPVFVQSAWSSDINGDGKTDLVLGKQTGVVINFTDLDVTADLDVSITFDGGTWTKNNIDLASNPIVSFTDITPNNVGDFTLTGTFSVNGVSQSLPEVYTSVKETTSPSIAYSYFYKVDRKGNLAQYGEVSASDYDVTAGECTEFIGTTYPVSSLSTDETYIGLEGADKGSRRDPYKGLIADALSVAQSAQLRMGGSAIGIGIGPNDPAFGTDYFAYHGFPGAAGISFGPSVKGVIILDGYYGGSAHEVAHTYGLYYGEPEEYQLYPLYGKITSGVRVEDGQWITGYDFMGAVPYGTVEDTWVDSETFAELFRSLRTNPVDPKILLVSGIIDKDGSVEFPNTWYSFEGVYDPFFVDGNYSLRLVDENGNLLDEKFFDASFEIQIGGYPNVEVGTDGTLIDFGGFTTPVETDVAGFSFVIPYNSETAEVQIWDLVNDVQIGVVDASEIVTLGSTAWTTSENFDKITGLEANFQVDSSDEGATLNSLNPDSSIYLNIVEDNMKQYATPTTVTITLPNVENSTGNIVPAWNLKGPSPIQIYTDTNRKNDITADSTITVDGNTLTIESTITEDSLVYVTVHLDYALKGTDGWPEDSSTTFLQEFDFEISIDKDGELTEILVPFQVIGSETT